MFESFVTLGGDKVTGVDCVKGIGVWLAGPCVRGILGPWPFSRPPQGRPLWATEVGQVRLWYQAWDLWLVQSKVFPCQSLSGGPSWPWSVSQTQFRWVPATWEVRVIAPFDPQRIGLCILVS